MKNLTIWGHKNIFFVRERFFIIILAILFTLEQHVNAQLILISIPKACEVTRFTGQGQRG